MESKEEIAVREWGNNVLVYSDTMAAAMLDGMMDSELVAIAKAYPTDKQVQAAMKRRVGAGRVDDNKELSELAEKIAKQKLEIEKAENAIKIIKTSFESNKAQMLNLLSTLNIDSVKMFGFTFYTQIMESVKTPKTLEAKRELFEYLKELGIYEETVSVNSQTLNSLFKTMSQKAAEEGILDFKMPGVEEPTPVPELRLRKIS
jgi:hypothetical protein